MKKLAIATLVFGVMSSSVFAAEVVGGTGKITFDGSIITSPCSIAPGDESQNVPLGQVSNTLLENGNRSIPQDFSIKLQGCVLQTTYKGENEQGEEIDIPYKNTVSVEFSGTEWANDAHEKGLLQISGQGKGAGVVLLTPSGTKIDINSVISQDLVKDDNNLAFQAALQGVKGEEVTPGKFSATANFVLKYN